MSEIEENCEEIDYDLTMLNNIREKIEKMSKFNQIEVLRILNNHKEVTINENKYGIHINLTELSNELIEELKVYINYVNTQEFELNQAEQEKENYKNTYFDNKDNKDNKDKSNNIVY
jgi:hypothetical protein